MYYPYQPIFSIENLIIQINSTTLSIFCNQKMRLPINLRRGLMFRSGQALEALLKITFTENKPTGEHGSKNIYLCHRLQIYDHHTQQRCLMDTVVGILPLPWAGAIYKVYPKYNPTIANELLNC